MNGFAIALALAVLLALPAAPGHAQDVAESGVLTPDEVWTIEAQVQEVRGETAIRASTLRVVTDAELATHLRDLELEPDPAYVKATLEMMVLLGYVRSRQRLSRDVELEDDDLQPVSTGIAGLYDPENQIIFVVNDASPPPRWLPQRLRETREMRREVRRRAVYAHEFAHALQDQHHDLPALDGAVVNSDQMMAIHAVIEGDATASTERWALAFLDDGAREMLLLGSYEDMADKVGVLPYARRDQQQFLYGDGARLSRQAFERGGPAGVARIFAEPPTSTEQVLHPEKYWDRDAPLDIQFDNLPARLGPGWELVYSDVLGELGLDLLLQWGGKPDRADTAAAGWGGDRWAVFDHGGRPAMVLRTMWDTELDAREFFDTVASGLRERYPDAASVATTPTRQSLEATEPTTVSDVRLRGREVVLAIAADRASVDSLMGSLQAP